MPSKDQLELVIGTKVSEVQPMVITDGGSHSRVFMVLTADGEYVLRIPKGAQGFCTRFVTSHIDRSKWFDQRWATDVARGVGIPAPRIVFSSRGRGDDAPFVIMERLSGAPIYDYERWNGCPYDEKEFGHILGKLHAIEVSGAGPIDDFGTTYFETWADFLSAMAERLLQLCSDRGSIDEEISIALRGKWLPVLHTLTDVRPRLLHLESLGFANILFDRETRGITGFLDYEDCIGGDPLFEFAWMYYYYGHPASGQRYFDYERFLKGYGSIPQDLSRIEVYKAFMWLDKLSWIKVDSERAVKYRNGLRKICSPIT